MRGGNGGSGIVVVRYSESGTPSGKWSEVESSQVDGVADANKAAVETTLDAIQTALPAGATAAAVAITPGGTSFTAELKRIDGRDSGFMKVELK